MRRVLSAGGLLVCLATLASFTPARADVSADFDDVPLGAGGYWNGSDLSGGFASQALWFGNETTDWGGGFTSWSGFSCSRVNDTNTPGYGNQYAVISGTGVGGTGQYAVVYCDPYAAARPAVTLPVAGRVKGFFINNTTYTVRDLQQGSGFSEPFGGDSGDDPDWLKLTIVGRDAAGRVTGTNVVYLADYRFADNALDYIVQAWTWVDLTALGDTVKKLEFTMAGTDPGTPTYFAMDDLTTLETYAPEAGAPGTTAVAADTNALVAWATGWTNYQAGANCAAQWQQPGNALGVAEVTGTLQGTNGIVCLGDAGRITLTFDTPIQDGPGNDFAVFENATGGFGEYFLEATWVEVSSDGTNFHRMFNRSITPRPLASYDTTAPTNVTGLGCKYEGGYGEPYDLGELAGTATNLDLHAVRFVRLIDIVGDGSCTDSVGHVIYDPYPLFGSAGFDLDAVGVLSNNTEEVDIVATLPLAAETGPWRAQFTVTRKTWSTAAPLVVRLALSGLASNGTDYAATPATVTLPAGSHEATVTILPFVDAVTEADETVLARVLPDPAYLVGRAAAATAHLVDRLPATLETWRAQSLQTGFENVPLGAGGYWNGSDLSGGFASQALWFGNETTDWGGGFTSWSGFSCSRVNDTNTPGYGNQYAVISGTGVGGTGQYAVVYCDPYAAARPAVALPIAGRVKGFFINNTTYTVRDLQQGSGFSEPFGGDSGNDPDWLKLTIVGRDAAGQATGTNVFYLADYRFTDNALDYIVQAWTWVDLTALGDTVKKLEFTMAGTDPGTPTYFAMDGLEIDPASAAAGDAADWNGDGTANLMAYALGADMGTAVAGAVTLVTTNIDGLTYVEAEYGRRHALAGVTLWPAWTTRLADDSWVGGAGHVAERVLATGAATETIRARLLDSATNSVGFVRLEATRP